MARQTTIIQVFVGSPGDVEEERATLELVISQLNQIWSRTLGLTFELLKWETNVRPAFSVDPQTAINDQIGIEYDVFIGIFWGRLGTTTPRAQSGTLEEFERAYSRFTETGSAPEIMLYFKDAPIAPSKLDPDQLKGVQEFKRSLIARGGLYYDFEDTAGFESSIRAHLSAIAQKFTQPSVALATLTEETPSVPQAEDELGYFDHIEVYVSKIGEMTMALEIINEATLKVGEQVSQHGKAFLKDAPSSPQIAKQLVSRAADDMMSYATIMETQVSELSSARIVALNALSNALSLRNHFSGNDNEDLLVLRDSLSSMKEGAGNARDSMAGMREATAGLPPMTKELNRAKRVMASKIDSLLTEIDSLQSTISNIVEAIDQMLDRVMSVDSAA